MIDFSRLPSYGMISFSSPSFTRISTTSTSYSVMEELDDKEEGMNPEEFEGDVDATSDHTKQVNDEHDQGHQQRWMLRTSVFDVGRDKQILRQEG